jgi:hypothetical protein
MMATPKVRYEAGIVKAEPLDPKSARLAALRSVRGTRESAS